MVAAIIVALIISVELVIIEFYDLSKKIKGLEARISRLEVTPKEDKFKDFRNHNGLFTNKRK